MVCAHSWSITENTQIRFGRATSGGTVIYIDVWADLIRIAQFSGRSGWG